MDFRALRKERTEFGKKIRSAYESGEVKLSRHKMTRWAVRNDEVSNTLTTVLKDNYIAEIYKAKGSDSMTEYKEPLTKPDVQYDFTFTELFAGIGGVSFGFESVGGKCVLAAEYDPTAEGKRQFAQDAYRALHPDTPVVGDVFKLDAKDVPDCDVLSFTTPCQSFSVAGKRLGFEDTRGTLVFEALRIAKEKRPKALFMENVKGLVNHDAGRTIDTILHAMNEVGYTVDFNVLNSKYFGVPQNRERVFIVALRDDLIEPTEWNPVGNTMLSKAKRRLKEEGLRTFNFDWPEQSEVTKRLRDVLETQVDEKYYLSVDKTAKLVVELEAKTHAIDISTPNMLGHIDLKGHDAIKRVYSEEGQAPTLTTMGGGHREPKVAEEVRPVITPDRTDKRQNGRRFKDDGEEAFTCTAVDRHGVAIGEYPRYRIRKLTPRETMRLQGFPESATDSLYAEGFSDSRIYKFAGNAVTTTVIKALGEKLVAYLDERVAQ